MFGHGEVCDNGNGDTFFDKKSKRQAHYFTCGRTRANSVAHDDSQTGSTKADAARKGIRMLKVYNFELGRTTDGTLTGSTVCFIVLNQMYGTV